MIKHLRCGKIYKVLRVGTVNIYRRLLGTCAFPFKNISQTLENFLKETILFKFLQKKGSKQTLQKKTIKKYFIRNTKRLTCVFD